MNAADRCTRRAVHSMAASRGCGVSAVSAVSAAAGGPGRRPRAAEGPFFGARHAPSPRQAIDENIDAVDAPCTVRPRHARRRARASAHAMAWPTTRHAAMVHGVNDWPGKTMLCLKVQYQTSYRLITMCERIGNASAHGHGAITVQHPLEVRTNWNVRIRNGGCGLLQLLGILG